MTCWKIKTPQEEPAARKIERNSLLSAYRRDSRRPLSDKATYSDKKRGCADAKNVNHSGDYTSDFATLTDMLVATNPAG
jgi:hypothetical protein